jgi:hypothetical protein
MASPFASCSLRRLTSALVLCGLLAACGGTAVRDNEAAAGASGNAEPNPGGEAGNGPLGAAGDVGAVGDAGAAGDASAAGAASSSCPAGLPGPVLITVTPRADTNLELLALHLAGGIVADQFVYDRLVRDVGAIRSQDARVAGIQYFARGDGKSIGLSPDASTYAAMRAGSYHAWDCLNQTYLVTNTQFIEYPNLPSVGPNVLLTLKGIYNIPTLVTQYATLPGVKAFDGGPGGGDGPTICVTRESDAWHYVFDRAGGDCPAGCTEHTYYHFSTNAGGAVTSLGEIPVTEDSPYTSYAACRQ